MKQKMIALLAIVSVFCSLSAQRANETVTLFGKDQLQGFTINVNNYPLAVVDGAMCNIFENQYKLKGSKKKGYHVYENQQCSAFGDARYDLYFTTTEIGKKNNKAVQVTLVVSTGNMNCVTFANDPRTSRNIVSFLEKFDKEVERYDITLRIQDLENKLTKLRKERDGLLSDSAKLVDKIANTNDELKQLSDRLERVTAEVATMQEEFNNTLDAGLKAQLDEKVKEKQTLQKNQASKQKNLTNLNENLIKVNAKLRNNATEIETAEKDLKALKQSL